MRTLRLVLAGTVIVVLLGGLGGAVMAQSEESDAMAFPTGTLVAVETPDHAVEFNEDGTGRWFSYGEGWEVPDTYAVNGDFYTEMAFDDLDGRQVPATYYWDFDGEHLSFELWGEDLRPHRNSVMTGNTWRLVLDPREVLVAARDRAPGEFVGTYKSIAPAAETDPEAFTHDGMSELVGHVAAVPVSKGEVITPDMVEPAQ